ncbi:MAG: ABC transporter substrate-binding protein [Candidatus Lambdaproteobacteria bacterium]|nr:ABC transporter substrate-binding protein [Candidatus Lambdaproteobacteria bacterium]
MSCHRIVLILAVALLVGVGAGPATAQKYGGTLNVMALNSPPSLSPMEVDTIATVWPMSPVYSNLVYYDPLEPKESFDALMPELAESWSWDGAGTALTFKLRQGVKFHDGQPFTARDVKLTFDVSRGANVTQRLKLNPRKAWWKNIEEIVANGDHEVTFRVKRVQPSLLAMLASGFSTVYPAHIPYAALRTRGVGTGPFVFKEYKADRHFIHTRNPDYFVKGRPYLDGLNYRIITSRSTQTAAILAREVDLDAPSATTKPIMEHLKSANDQLIFRPTARYNLTGVRFNPRRKPWDNPLMRQAVSLALDRDAMIQAVFQGGAQRGGILLPPPDGVWGLPEQELRQLPGYGDAAKNREQARENLRGLGYGEQNRLKVKISVRNSPQFVEPGVFTAGAMKAVYMDAELAVIDPALWAGMLARRDFEVAVGSTGVSIGDPDATFYENFSCGSIRNYTDYCNPEVDRMMDAQSQQTDGARRAVMAREVDKRLLIDGAQIVYGFRINYNARWPDVKNFVPHPNHYSYGRMQDVWLDR